MTRFKFCPKICIIVTVLVVVGLFFTLTGCEIEPESEPQGKGFAIYRIEQTGNITEDPDLLSIEIGETPLIGLNDIICYDTDTHEFILTDNAFSVYRGIEGTFAVCVDRQPVYTGVFWNWFSSMSLDRIVILEKLSVDNKNIVVIQAGYPGQEDFNGEDLRGDERIMNSLRKAGKLVELPTLGEEIPTPLKGWELYSFERDGEWHYTLVFGTNRLKWRDEIIFDDGDSDENGIYHRVGTGEIISLLSRLADGAPVYWGTRFSSNAESESDVVITIPPDDIVHAVSHYANEFGLDFYVHQN